MKIVNRVQTDGKEDYCFACFLETGGPRWEAS